MTVKVTLAISTGLFHQQSDNNCKIQHEAKYKIKSLFIWGAKSIVCQPTNQQSDGHYALSDP
jgi:hypothetical protein